MGTKANRMKKGVMLVGFHFSCLFKMQSTLGNEVSPYFITPNLKLDDEMQNA